MCTAWAASSTPPSSASIWNGKIAPLSYLHKQLDITSLPGSLQSRVGYCKVLQLTFGDLSLILNDALTLADRDPLVLRVQHRLWRRGPSHAAGSHGQFNFAGSQQCD